MEENNPVPLISLSTLYEAGKLSTRAANTCMANRIKDTRMLLQFYHKNGNFLLFRNMGVKTNKELTDFCTALEHQTVTLPGEREGSLLSPTKFFLIYEAYTSLNARQKQTFDFLAESLINELPPRAQNTLRSQSFRNPTVAGIIQRFADKDFSFLRIRNAGVLTVGQLENFTLQLSKLFALAKSEEHAPQIIRTGVEDAIATKIKGCSAIFKDFLFRCSKPEAGDPFPIWKFLERCFFQTEIIKPVAKQSLLASGKFFEKRAEALAGAEAQTYSVSRERIRQLTVKEHLNAVFLDKAKRALADLNPIGIGNNFSYFAEIEDDFLIPNASTLNAQNNTQFTTAFFCYAISTFSGHYVTYYSKLQRVHFLLHRDLHTTLNFESLLHTVERLLKTSTPEGTFFHLEDLMQRFSYSHKMLSPVPPDIWERTQNGVEKMIREIYGIHLCPDTETRPTS